jgi:DNA processing protein
VSDAELRALLQLRCVPGLGDVGLARLLREHGSAEAVLGLDARITGVPVGATRSALAVGRVQRALRTLDALDVAVFALHLPGYPQRLLSLHDPPVLLFARGDTRLLEARGIAVVGTRRPTDYGIDVTELLVAGAARAGLVVWSGAARGIDAVAHCTALDCGRPTVAVLGCGIDVAYPHEHAGMLDQIALDGLLLSEFLPGEPPLAHNFPRRNRILARVPHGVLVIEAREDGGALITAEYATGHNAVMAVPGPIGRVTSLGPNRLLQDGAKLVMEVGDILEELGGPLNARAAAPRPSAKRQWQSARPAQPTTAPAARKLLRTHVLAAGTLEPDAERVYRALHGDAQHVDGIAERAGLAAPRVLACLLELEVAGHAEASGGKRYRLPQRPEDRQPAA